jgi:hypothetical protein
MVRLEDRQNIAQDVSEAHKAGARLSQACEEAGIDVRILQRWRTTDGLTSGDARPRAVRPIPAHALSAEERDRVLAVANEPRFADMALGRIIPALAEKGCTSPANPPSAGSCARTVRTLAAAAPRRPGYRARRRRTWPPHRARYEPGMPRTYRPRSLVTGSTCT